MGIKRCPYCRALISDQDPYCKNCGTQLLFPEDEEIEEEIPGDRIIEDDRQRDETDIVFEEAGDRTEEIFDELEEVEEEGGEKSGEVILIDEERITSPVEIAETESFLEPPSVRGEADTEIPQEEEVFVLKKKSGKSISGEKERKLSTGEEEFLVEKIKKEILEKEEQPGEKEGSKAPGLVTRMVEDLLKEDKKKSGETQKAAGPGPVTRMMEELGVDRKRADTRSKEVRAEGTEPELPLTFESAELDKIGATTEIGRREVDDFFRVLEEKEKEIIKERARPAGKTAEETGTVPPWIKEVESASTELLPGEVETGEVKLMEKLETETEELLEEGTPAASPTIGIPESVTLTEPVEQVPEEEMSGELEIELEERLEEESRTARISTGSGATSRVEISTPEIARTIEKERTLPPLSFKSFVKAKIFDLLFLVMFWLISVWMVARSMETTIFKLFSVASSGLLIYLLILSFFYFFLFYFFTGETLGDRLFRDEEEESPDSEV